MAQRFKSRWATKKTSWEVTTNFKVAKGENCWSNLPLIKENQCLDVPAKGRRWINGEFRINGFISNLPFFMGYFWGILNLLILTSWYVSVKGGEVGWLAILKLLKFEERPFGREKWNTQSSRFWPCFLLFFVGKGRVGGNFGFFFQKQWKIQRYIIWSHQLNWNAQWTPLKAHLLATKKNPRPSIVTWTTPQQLLSVKLRPSGSAGYTVREFWPRLTGGS